MTLQLVVHVLQRIVDELNPPVSFVLQIVQYVFVENKNRHYGVIAF